MTDEFITNKHSYVIAHQYNFIPYEPLKCERTIPIGDTNTLFFANTSNIVKILIKYDVDDLEDPV